MAFLYWLYDSRCSSPEEHGYIGATIDVKRRFAHHKKRRFGRKGIKCKVLYEGPYQECLQKEAILRPRPGIGWNIYDGKNKSASLKFRKWLSKRLKGRSVTWGDKISKTMTGRKIGPPTEEHRRNLSKANKGNPKLTCPRPWLSGGPFATNRKGRTHSKETREKMRKAWIVRKSKLVDQPTTKGIQP